MTLRERLARWLCPQLALAADRGWWLRKEMQEMDTWLARDFPIISVALRRLAIGELNHFRALSSIAVENRHPEHGGIWPWGIYEFREKLRRTFPAQLPSREL